MIIDGQKVEFENTLEADICVIGASASGITFAFESAKRGYNTILVEEGTFEKNENKPFIQHMGSRLKNLGVTYTTSRPYILIPTGIGVGGGTFSTLTPLSKINENVYNKLIFKNNFPIALKDPLFKTYNTLIDWLSIKESVVNQDDPILNNFKNKDKIVFSHFSHLDLKSDSTLPFRSLMLNSVVDDFLKLNGTLLTSAKVNSFDVKKSRIIRAGVNTIIRGEKNSHSIDISAKLFVASCGAIYSPILLYRNLSKSIHNITGKNLKLSPKTFLFGLFKNRNSSQESSPLNSYQLNHLLDEYSITIERIQLPDILLGVFLPGISNFHSELLKKYKNNYILLSVTLLEKSSSGFVLPSPFTNPFVKYKLTNNDFILLKKGIEKTAELLFESGATKVILQGFDNEISNTSSLSKLLQSSNLLSLTSHTPVGTLKMGQSEENSVVNQNGYYRKMENLIIADESILPDSIPVDPTLTTMALAKIFAQNVKL